ncbi:MULTISPECIES: NIPSNAP family protein [Rhodococcus]|uniref:NIPSNAP family protein n=2 Tax=Rhodococcus TaxID=1827 RepID=A0AA46P5D2_9NOCA|nr:MULTISPECIES: NIPSNAP family protein [Rhodococcus]KHJ74477.1 NIPSNAP family containing protein [Rhodococcus sp. Chr-9]MBX4171537.1 NIPSNAP family protein [Rhodococcus sp. DMU2021]MCD2114989.1 NIPSNAP family protein [Rhodococcus rhodochrous]MCD5422715.1 NIPSNAP family protein [Rhodococcus pyridinivorans]MCW3471145.1 NIPSNAP family protein [Rhodococcus pyridinivorans]
MIYEIREYVAVPGKLSAIIDLFTNHTARMFKRYDMELISAGHTLIGEHSFGELVYTVRFANLAELENKWSQMLADPEWQQAFAAAESDGPLIRTMRRRVIDGSSIEEAP